MQKVVSVETELTKYKNPVNRTSDVFQNKWPDMPSIKH